MTRCLQVLNCSNQSDHIFPMQGGEGRWSASNDFGHTTISNLEGDNDLIWIHIVITILFTVLGVAIMRRFSVNLRLEDDKDCIRDDIQRCPEILDIELKSLSITVSMVVW